MKLTKDTYAVSRATVELVLEVLSDNMFYSEDGESYNNDDVIATDDAFRSEIQAQEGK
jgi:hypothetical protein